MDAQIVTEYLTQYGAVAVFVIVFLEYMNLPGFPAGVIMPVSGIVAARGGLAFGWILLVSVLAGVLGSWVLYIIGRVGGEVFLGWFGERFPKQSPSVEKAVAFVRKNGYAGVFFAKLIPVVRTIISIPAGALGMNFAGYTLFSMLGITVWNMIFIGAGYLLGDAVFTLLG